MAVPEVRPLYVFASCLLVPSVLFWSGGIVKESLAIGGLGLLVYGAARWIERDDRVGAMPWLVVGALTVLLLKAYFLVPFAAAAGVWAAARRGIIRRGRRVEIRPERLLAGGVLALAGFVVVGSIFPSYALPNLIEEVAYRQELGAARAGGSTFVEETQVQRNAVSVLLWAPIGLITALVRPLLFEARSPVLLVSAAEMTVYLFLIARIVLGAGVTSALRRMLASPGLIFCAVMTLGVALGVGLSTVNMGTPARYRAPMLPFYTVLLLGMGATLVRRRRPSSPVMRDSGGIEPR